MARYATLESAEAEKALLAKGLEPLVVDGKLVAVIADDLRIYVSKSAIAVSQKEPTP